MPARRPEKPRPAEPEQRDLFGGVVQSRIDARPPRKPKEPDASGVTKWRMPELEGSTVAEIRLRWRKRLSPAQVARVAAEIGALPQLLEKLGFGAVEMERSFVRRRRTNDL